MAFKHSLIKSLLSNTGFIENPSKHSLFSFHRPRKRPNRSDTKMSKYWETHPDSIWLYDPNFPLAIVATVLYAITMVVQFWQTVFKYKSYYFIVVFFGALLEVGGYAARVASIKDYTSIVSPQSPHEKTPS
jgi:hypothetical protein